MENTFINCVSKFNILGVEFKKVFLEIRKYVVL